MLSISFDQALQDSGEGPLLAGAMTWLQVNLGKLCNQACHHCHVDAGPKRSEVMSAATADRVIALMRSSPQLELHDSRYTFFLHSKYPRGLPPTLHVYTSTPLHVYTLIS